MQWQLLMTVVFITVYFCESHFRLIGYNLPSGSAFVSPAKMEGIREFQKQVSEQRKYFLFQVDCWKKWIYYFRDILILFAIVFLSLI